MPGNLGDGSALEPARVRWRSSRKRTYTGCRRGAARPAYSAMASASAAGRGSSSGTASSRGSHAWSSSAAIGTLPASREAGFRTLCPTVVRAGGSTPGGLARWPAEPTRSHQREGVNPARPATDGRDDRTPVRQSAGAGSISRCRRPGDPPVRRGRGRRRGASKAGSSCIGTRRGGHLSRQRTLFGSSSRSQASSHGERKR